MKNENAGAAAKQMAVKIKSIERQRDVDLSGDKTLRALVSGDAEAVKLTDLLEIAKNLGVPVSNLAA